MAPAFALDGYCRPGEACGESVELAGYDTADRSPFVSSLEERVIGITFPSDPLEVRLARIEFRLFGKTAPYRSDGDRLNRLSHVVDVEAGGARGGDGNFAELPPAAAGSEPESGVFRLDRQRALNDTTSGIKISADPNQDIVEVSAADPGPKLGSKLKKHGLTALKFAAIAGMIAGQIYLSGGAYSGGLTGLGGGSISRLGVGGLGGGLRPLP